MFGVIKNWHTYTFDVSRYNDLDDIKTKLYELTVCHSETMGHDCIICFKDGTHKLSSWRIYWNDERQRALRGITNYRYYLDGVLLKHIYKEVDKVIFFDSIMRHPDFTDAWKTGLFSVQPNFSEKCDKIYKKVLEEAI